ncbi:MAG: tripartite tricarboxylate transporter substrate binding protein [Firmicutes bacterium]|nr:tripartite tricarboxylate transporter substrate binding protein [Bacillota bacterium]
MKNKTIAYKIVVLLALLTLSACSSQTPTASSDAPGPQVEFPAKDITILVPSGAGAPTDVLAREMGKAIEELTDVSVTVENATGGSGGVQHSTIFAKPADGYTWGVFTAGHIMSLQGELGKEFPMEKFLFVSKIQDDTWFFAVRGDSPFNTFEEFVAHCKENPGKVTIGGGANGTGQHLATLQLERDLGIDVVYVPFDGSGENMPALLGGHIDATWTSIQTVVQFEGSGDMKPLATISEERFYDDTPTFAELGITIPFEQWRGIYLKAGTDEATTKAVSDLIRKVTQSESFVTYMNNTRFADRYMPYPEFDAYVRDFFTTSKESAEALLAMPK